VQLTSAREAEEGRRSSTVEGTAAGSSQRESAKGGSESGKLKNLHCYKPLPGKGW
jgi:hypothetical protein